MKQLTLAVETREGKGSGESGRLRKAGKIPAIIYGKSGNRNLSVSDSNFRELLREMGGATAIIELSDDKGQKSLSVLHQTQRDACTDKFLHADFREVSQDTAMDFTVPVHVTGESDGVKNYGGNLQVLHHEAHVKCLPKDLPNSIDIDVTELGVGDSVHLKDIKLPSGVEAVGDGEQVIVLCAAPAAEKEEEPAAEAAEGEAKAEEKPAEGGDSGEAKADS